MRSPPANACTTTIALVVLFAVAMSGCSPARRIASADRVASGASASRETSPPPRGPPSTGSGQAVVPAPPPATPVPTAAAPFFEGAEALAERLDGLGSPTRGADGVPVVEARRLDDVEAALGADLRAAGRRDLGSFFVVATVVPLGVSPSRGADFLQDAGVERASLSAEEGEEVSRTPLDAAGRSSTVISVAMLRMGEWPFLYDFRWRFRVSREAAAGGVVRVRYDLVEDAPTEHVSFFRGVATLAPSPDGSVLREVVAVASPLSPPFFFKARVRGTVLSILRRRWSRLAESSTRAR